MFTVDCSKAYIRWNDMANHAKADHKKNRENTIVGSKINRGGQHGVYVQSTRQIVPPIEGV